MKFSMKLMAAMLLLAASLHVPAGEKITLMVSGIEKQIYLPAKLAEQLGYFKESGLDIELLSEPAGSNAEKEMLLGAAHGVIGFYDHTINLQARGKRVQSVVQFTLAPGEAILVAKAAERSIRSPADFRNKTLGVTGIGSSTNSLTKFLAAKSGVKKSEFKTVPVGAGETFISAMMQGRIDAGMTTEPTITRLTTSGAASVLVDLRTIDGTQAALGGPYPGACLYMPTAWINAHKDEVQKIVTALVRALQFIKTSRAEEIAAQMPYDYYGSDKQKYIAALEASKQIFTDDGVMPENGPSTVLRVMNGFDKAVQGKSINLANTFTNDFANAARQ